MPHAIRIYETGGPEKMRWEEVEVGAPGPSQVRVRNTAIGLNYIDTYHRGGLYPVPMPAILGSEGAGVVEAVGPRVKNFKPGDRVAYAQPIGAYAEVLLRPWERDTRAATPRQVRRAMGKIIGQLGTPARAPQPRGKAPGRAKGSTIKPAPRCEVIRKSPRKAKTTRKRRC